MSSLMLESVYAEQDGRPPLILVDLGYIVSMDGVVDQEVDARYRAVLATGVAKRNFSVEGQIGRLLVKLPTQKAPMVLNALPIVAGSTYWRTTHHWRGLKKGERKARVPQKAEPAK